jgi:hypothetical protein
MSRSTLQYSGFGFFAHSSSSVILRYGTRLIWLISSYF